MSSFEPLSAAGGFVLERGEPGSQLGDLRRGGGPHPFELVLGLGTDPLERVLVAEAGGGELRELGAESFELSFGITQMASRGHGVGLRLLGARRALFELGPDAGELFLHMRQLRARIRRNVLAPGRRLRLSLIADVEVGQRREGTGPRYDGPGGPDVVSGRRCGGIGAGDGDEVGVRGEAEALERFGLCPLGGAEPLAPQGPER